MIDTYYWADGKNFGDMLVPIIMKGVFNIDTQLVNPGCHGKYLIIGSELPNRGIVQPNDIIWGYGTRHDQNIFLNKGVKVLAVRGKLRIPILQNGLEILLMVTLQLFCRKSTRLKN